ncbi:MAG TPA: DUF2059 domain-containing protein [Terriglobales bacterium]|nr:DUF2059 domain-containing protein [Terriglobales bacterium]
MKRIAALTFCWIVLFATTAFAQTTAQRSADPDSATREQVLKMMEVMNLRQQTAETMEAYKAQMSAAVIEDMKARMPNAPAAMFDELKVAFEEMFTEMPVNEMIDAIIPVYQKHLTKQEVEATTAFYSTPEGKSMLRKMPIMVNESMQIALATMREKMDSASVHMSERVQEIMKKHGQEPHSHSDVHTTPSAKSPGPSKGAQTAPKSAPKPARKPAVPPKPRVN